MVSRFESDRITEAEEDLKVERISIDIARLLRPYTCPQRSRIERRVRELIGAA